MTNWCDRTATEQKRALEEREVSARELLDAHLQRIDEVNPSVNAVVALDPEVAQRRAAATDDGRANGKTLGALAGLVTAHKDLADTVDFPTTYGSPVHADHQPAADSLLVARMKAAGVVAVGKTNTPEFGAGSHTFNPVYGTTFNAFDHSRSAGGSSGGAAVALSTGMVSIADGSDMGGSLRNPAAWNNIVGFRSSPGLVPRIGPGPAHSTLAVDGAMGRTVDDVALLLSVIGAPDARDPLNRGVQISPEVEPLERPIRVAYSPTVGGLEVEPDIAAVIATFVDQVADAGWEVEQAEPDLTGADECFATLRSYLFATGALSDLSAEEMAQVKPTVREEFERGRAMTAQQIADASASLKELWQRTVAFFADVDLIIAPVTQVSPFPADDEYPTSVNGVPCERYIDWMRSVCRITVLGVPALSLPAGFTSTGLPVGAQLIGGPQSDAFVLRAAKTAASMVAIPPGTTG